MAVKPRIKLDKKEAKKGDIVEVKALVSHVMEPGQRRDNAGNVIPRKILNKFVCTVNGKQVFAADFEPAISANPVYPVQVQGRGIRAGGADLDRRRRLNDRRRRVDQGQLFRRHSGRREAAIRNPNRDSALWIPGRAFGAPRNDAEIFRNGNLNDLQA